MVGYERLAYAIVLQAVVDYRKRRKKKLPVVHLAKFFKSEWCQLLLSGSSTNGEAILKQLQSEFPTKKEVK